MVAAVVSYPPLIAVNQNVLVHFMHNLQLYFAAEQTEKGQKGFFFLHTTEEPSQLGDSLVTEKLQNQDYLDQSDQH